MRCSIYGLLPLLVAGVACDDGGGPDPAAGDARVVDRGPTADMQPTDMQPADMQAPDLGVLADNFNVVETEGDAQCDGLHPGHCLMPFPSDYFRAALDDGGFGLRFGPSTLPAYGRAGQHLRSEALAHADGWGSATPIMFTYPGATLLGAPPVFDPAAGLEPDSQTVLLDADTGERIAHWAEFDYLTLDAADPLIALRPAGPLPRDRRIIVAIRGLTDAQGLPLPATPGFAALRDQTASRTIGVHARRDRFEADIFAPLAAAGVARESLQLAWDFTTATAANGYGPLLSMRDQVMALIGADGPEVTVVRAESDDDDPDIRVRILATAEVPSFILPPDANGLRRLRLGEDGLPVAEGFETIEFEMQVPHAAFDGGDPVGVMMYGHGLLGSKNEARGRYLKRMAQTHRFIILATDMQGMAERDIGVWLRNLTSDPTAFPWFSEKPMQGVINQLALLRGVKGRLADTPELQFAEGEAAGQPIFNADDLMYYGNSQGGTIGTLMMALTPDVPRGVLGVPGCCYPILLQRNADFVGQYVSIFDNIIPDRVEFALILGLLGTGFDRLDPFTFGPFVTDDPLPGTPPHAVLLQIAKEDPSVHNQVSHMLARAIDAPLLTPAVRSIWGLPTATYPQVGSGVVEFDFALADDDTPQTPPALNGSHGWLRAVPEAQQQMMRFLRTGEITDTCPAPCGVAVP